MTELPARLPVHVLTGPLGSGKSTLLNRIMHDGLAADTAIIVNEFGQAGLDQTFIQSQASELLVMENGCICCALRTDLVDTLMELAARRDDMGWPLRRVIVETSGISDPVPLLHTLRRDTRIRDRYQPGLVICTADAHAGTTALTERPEYQSQLVAADIAVITKADLADPSSALAFERAIAGLNPLATLLHDDIGVLMERLETEAEGDVSRRAYAAVMEQMAPTDLPGGQPAPDRGHGVRHVVLRYPGPVSWPNFAIWLTRLIFLHGDRILRTKGVLFDRDRAVWIGVHGVRGFLHPPVHLSLDAPPGSGSCLVFITDGLDPARIERAYRDFWSAVPADAARER